MMPLKTSQAHFFQIVRKNAFTPVNTILFLLGFGLILLGQGFDTMVSVDIVLFNTVVSVVQGAIPSRCTLPGGLRIEPCWRDRTKL